MHSMYVQYRTIIYELSIYIHTPLPLKCGVYIDIHVGEYSPFLPFVRLREKKKKKKVVGTVVPCASRVEMRGKNVQYTHVFARE